MSEQIPMVRVRDLLKGLGNHADPSSEPPGEEWVGFAAATRFCDAEPQVLARAARDGIIRVRWFQPTAATAPVPLLSRHGVEQIAADLRRGHDRSDQAKRLRETGDTAPARRARPWIQAYQRRITQGLEECRQCGATESLWVCRVDRHKPWTLTNATILCAEHAPDHASRGGAFHWRWGMETFADEEKVAPPEQRWGLAALNEARRKAREKARESAAGG